MRQRWKRITSGDAKPDKGDGCSAVALSVFLNRKRLLPRVAGAAGGAQVGIAVRPAPRQRHDVIKRQLALNLTAAEVTGSPVILQDSREINALRSCKLNYCPSSNRPLLPFQRIGLLVSSDVFLHQIRVERIVAPLLCEMGLSALTRPDVIDKPPSFVSAIIVFVVGRFLGFLAARP